MDFLADVWVTCPVCNGHRFNRETLQVRFKGKSIADVLEMDVQEALDPFRKYSRCPPQVANAARRGLGLCETRPAIADAFRRRGAADQAGPRAGEDAAPAARLYLLDEPTTGLHFADIQMLLKVLHDLVDAGNTVLVVEHNLDVIKTADWIIDLGPEGGAGGGEIVAVGTPEQVVGVQGSKYKQGRSQESGVSRQNTKHQAA